MKKLALAVLAIGVLAASVASAASYEGKWGTTVLDQGHPLGLTFGLGKTAAVDLGLGFHTQKFPAGAFADSGTKLAWDAKVKVRTAVVEADNANLTLGAFFSYGQEPTGALDGTGNAVKIKNMSVGAEIGGEYWLSNLISIHAAHGIAWMSNKTGDADALTSFASTGDVFGNAGITLWFGGRK